MVKDITIRGNSKRQAYGNKGSYPLVDRQDAVRKMGTRTSVQAHASGNGKDIGHVENDN